MGIGRRKLEDLFIINQKVLEKKLYIWISDNRDDIENMSYILKQCIVNNIVFFGFATDCKALIGLPVLNKRIYDIEEIMNEKDSLVLSKDRNEMPYCPLKLLNPKLDQADVVIWGAGNNGRVLADYFSKKNISINCFIDSDYNKVGSYINGIKIYGIEKIETLSPKTSLIEASNQYTEIDKIVQEKVPEIDCYIYSNVDTKGFFVPGRLMYLKEVIQNRNIYIYGYNDYARQLSWCLTILNYHFAGFLVDESQIDKCHRDDEVCIMPEELLYFDNYFVIIVSDENESCVNRLRSMGLQYSIDFSPLEVIDYNLLYVRKNIIDINLGHTYKQKSGMNGIEIYGYDYPDNYKIVVLGGSTSDGKLFPFMSWPEIMYDKINNKKTVVYNAGVSGYTSAQELLKLIRDVILLKPDMIIVYDGYNDTSEINACPGKYFEFIYLKKALDFAKEHMNHDWDFISQEEDIETESAFPVIGNFENWLMNIEMMHAIAVDRKIKFYSFLQPMLSSKKNLTKAEKGLLFEVENFCGLKKTSLMGKEFRKKIGSVVRSHDYIHDLSHIFDEFQDVYMDICHVRKDANEIVATEILKRIEVLM